MLPYRTGIIKNIKNNTGKKYKRESATVLPWRLFCASTCVVYIYREYIYIPIIFYKNIIRAGAGIWLMDSASEKAQAKDGEKTSFSSAVKRLATLAAPHSGRFSAAIAALVVTSLSNLALPTILGLAVDRVSGTQGNGGSGGAQAKVGGAPRGLSAGSSSSSLMDMVRGLQDTQFFLGCLSVFTVGSLSSWFRTYTLGSVTEMIACDLRAKIYSVVLRRDLSSDGCDDPSGGDDESIGNSSQRVSTSEVVQALSVESDLLASAVSKQFTNLLRGCSSFFGGSIMLLTISPKLTAAALGVIPLLGTTAMLKRLSTRSKAKRVAERLTEANSRADERLKNLRTVKVFAQEQQETDHYLDLVRSICDMRTQVAFSEGVFMGSLNFAMTSSLLGIMCFGGLMVKRGEMTGGKLTSFMGYTMWLGLGAASLANIRAKTIETVAASRNVFRVLDSAMPSAEIVADQAEGGAGPSDGKAEEIPLSSLKGDIVFTGVRFRYDGGDSIVSNSGGIGHEDVGSAFNLTLQGQRQTALVGPSGAGKSTVASLLLRLYDVQEGKITIGGVDINEMPIAKLREAIGVVDQRPILWKGTIRENIRYGLSSASDEQIEKAARDAFVTEFTSRMPRGLDTVIGEAGNTLSGGQIARVAIARAIVKDPPILILDEATSSLDAASETVVRDAINRIMQKRTTLVIGHSLDAIRDANHVAVLEKGQVSEEGTIEELKGKSGSKLMKFVSSANPNAR